MAKKKPPARRTARKPAAAKKSKKMSRPASVADMLPEVSVAEERKARVRFAASLVKRGQAVPTGQPLPSGATHEITGKDKDGNPIVKRKRFSLR